MKVENRCLDQSNEAAVNTGGHQRAKSYWASCVPFLFPLALGLCSLSPQAAGSWVLLKTRRVGTPVASPQNLLTDQSLLESSEQPLWISAINILVGNASELCLSLLPSQPSSCPLPLPPYCKIRVGEVTPPSTPNSESPEALLFWDQLSLELALLTLALPALPVSHTHTPTPAAITHVVTVAAIGQALCPVIISALLTVL